MTLCPKSIVVKRNAVRTKGFQNEGKRKYKNDITAGKDNKNR
jgi:hypothetical protein